MAPIRVLSFWPSLSYCVLGRLAAADPPQTACYVVLYGGLCGRINSLRSLHSADTWQLSFASLVNREVCAATKKMLSRKTGDVLSEYHHLPPSVGGRGADSSRLLRT